MRYPKAAETHTKKASKNRQEKEYIFVFKTEDGRFCQTQPRELEVQKQWNIDLWDVCITAVVCGRFIGNLLNSYIERI